MAFRARKIFGSSEKRTPVTVLTIGESLFYTFCLINICLSLSDDANKIKTLNIERA